MSIVEDINRILELVRSIEEEGECPVRYSPGRSDNLIEKAELYIGGFFPSIYHDFIKKFDVLTILGEEFYGLCGDSNFENSSVPNAIWVTKEQRKESNVFSGMLVFHSDNAGGFHAFELLKHKSHVAGNCPVYHLDIHDGFEKSVVSDTFTEFICGLVNDAWEYW